MKIGFRIEPGVTPSVMSKVKSLISWTMDEVNFKKNLT